MVLNTATVSMAVTPTVVSTLFSHYLNRKPLRQRPTAHLSYDEGLRLVRSFLLYASHHTVEELQAFTAQWVPHPQWVRVEEVTVPDDQLGRAASLLEEQLGPEGIERVGGRQWWQWRKPRSPLRAEWIEMRADYYERKQTGAPLRRVMLYVHGGAYFFGSVDEHRYQMQRHARKLKARVLAPRYRLAPQFPFPCGLQDCLAAYLHLLTLQDPSTIVLAGDSAGGGMVLSLLVILRDRGLPLPAGAILISPWVDLTHSFPSVSQDCPLDYIPPCGFHHRPSMAWPPPTEDDLAAMGHADTAEAAALQANRLPVTVGGKAMLVKEQIQMYTTNSLMTHPLVSPVLQPTLGGLPPLLIMVGGGEILRDEQIHVAHKCANPAKYAPPDAVLDEQTRAAIQRHPPTDVQLQVWDDLCHVAPTLSFTRPAKYMFRSVAQFGAWALARAQKTEIDILADDRISVISSSGSDTDAPDEGAEETTRPESSKSGRPLQVGKAGDALPAFKGHMIRQRVTRHGDILPLAPPSQLPGCCMAFEHIGVPKEGPVSKWLQTKQQWDSRYESDRSKVHKRRLRDAAVGFESFGAGEHPPPSALAGRRRIGADLTEKRLKKRSYGLALWSLWGSKHDESTVAREKEADEADEQPETRAIVADGSRPSTDQSAETARDIIANSRSHRRFVRDENQAEPDGRAGVDEDAPVTGVTGKRPFLSGIALPFTLNKEADTASMVTLHSVDPANHNAATHADKSA